MYHDYFLIIEAAAWVVMFPSMPIAPPFIVLTMLVAADFPPVTKITTTKIKMIVNGIAKYGEWSHKNTSSIATSKNRTQPQSGIEPE